MKTGTLFIKLIEALGYSENSKLLIIHADDAGLCHAENVATMQAVETGMVNSYSIMVPCPWFNEMAQYAKRKPSIDYGIHLTLTCEWQDYKFGPVLPADEVPSLVDKDGYFYPSRKLLAQHAVSDEIRKELKAQVERALNFGLRPSHLDSHMYSVGARAEFLDIYRGLGRFYGLPTLINRQMMEQVGLNADLHIRKDDLVVDRVFLGTFSDFEKGRLADYYEQVLNRLPSGLNVILIHPAFDNHEMQGIAINHPNFGSEWRQTDYDYFSSQRCRTALFENDIKLITWSDIKNVISKS
ncbi:MAG: polysaccharide deacetylase family protein [Imperialibacter sp.]|uniref:polysaccharide deacetylase family protein n=1 Tax=Imperialibacter sp. TaxID=2038411 RepID=UPI0032EEAB34